MLLIRSQQQGGLIGKEVAFQVCEFQTTKDMPGLSQYKSESCAIAIMQAKYSLKAQSPLINI